MERTHHKVLEHDSITKMAATQPQLGNFQPQPLKLHPLHLPKAKATNFL